MGNSRFEQSFVSFYLIFWSVVLAIELSVIIKRKPDVWRLWSLMSSSTWETLVLNKLCIFLSHFLKGCSCNWVECHHETETWCLEVVIVDEQLNMGNSRSKQNLYLFISFFEVLFLQLSWVSSLNGNLMSGGCDRWWAAQHGKISFWTILCIFLSRFLKCCSCNWVECHH